MLLLEVSEHVCEYHCFSNCCSSFVFALFSSVPLGFFPIASVSNSPNCIQVDKIVRYSTLFALSAIALHKRHVGCFVL